MTGEEYVTANRAHGIRDAIIDLRAATLDSTPTGGGVVSYADSIYGGFTIAHNVVIENATGGLGNDHITGNEFANILTGDDGNDTFAFHPSNDNDFVCDFDPGADIIELGGFYNIPTNLPAQLPPEALSHLLMSFSDLDIETIDWDGNTGVDSSVIHFDANNSVTVLGVVGLTAADFDFVV